MLTTYQDRNTVTFFGSISNNQKPHIYAIVQRKPTMPHSRRGDCLVVYLCEKQCLAVSIRAPVCLFALGGRASAPGPRIDGGASSQRFDSSIRGCAAGNGGVLERGGTICGITSART